MRSWKQDSVERFLKSFDASTGMVVLILMLLSVLPLVVLGERSWITVHDNLDSNFVWLVNAVRQGVPFILGTDGVLPNVMNGLPRSATTSLINVVTVFYLLLPPFWAFVANAAVVRLLALIGCAALLRRCAPDSRGFHVVAVWAGLLFALLPFYTVWGVTVAGLPLLLNAFLNIEDRRARWRDWVVLLVFPFFSSLYLIGIFLLALAGARSAYLLVRARTNWRPAAFALGVLMTGYAVAEWPFLSMLFSHSAIPMQREEFDSSGLFAQSGGPSVGASFQMYFLHGQGHASILHVWPILLCLVLALPRLYHSPRRTAIFRLLVMIVATAFFASIYIPLMSALGPSASLVHQFQFQRFYFFLPLFWFVVFGIALGELMRMRIGRVAVPVLMALQAGSILYSNREIAANLAILYRAHGQRPSFGEFFDPDLFSQVRDRIGQPASGYRVIAVGLHPSILQYNGFYTLDSYQNLYPLAYKHRFREMIANELNKDESLRVYFDSWGSRCYVFSAELGKYYLWDKESDKSIHDLALDVDAFHALGGRYIVSSVPITRIAGVTTKVLGVFESPRSYWRIYLYDLG